jgi:hypothetical protein
MIMSLMALGFMVSGVGLWHFAADSTGCQGINTTPSGPNLGVQGPVTLEAGEVISLTAGEPSTGSPTTVSIMLDGSTVASVPYPGTAT